MQLRNQCCTILIHHRQLGWLQRRLWAKEFLNIAKKLLNLKTAVISCTKSTNILRFSFKIRSSQNHHHPFLILSRHCHHQSAKKKAAPISNESMKKMMTAVELQNRSSLMNLELIVACKWEMGQMDLQESRLIVSILAINHTVLASSLKRTAAVD